MASESYDGHPQQAGGEAGILTGRHPQFSIVGLVEAVVIARRYVDQPGNRYRNAVEYDVRDLATGQPISNVRTLQRTFGVASGEEHVFHPATKVTAPGQKLNAYSKAADTDGDVVLVAFVNGSRQNPVILGALPHPRVSYGAKEGDGERRYFQHADTTVEVKKDGEVLVQHAPSDATPTFVRISADGNVTIEGASNKNIKINFAGLDAIDVGYQASWHAIKGEAHRSTFNALVDVVNNLVDAFASHVHVLAAVPTSQPVVVPSPPTPSVGTKIQADGFSPTLPTSVSQGSEMPDSDLSSTVRLR